MTASLIASAAFWTDTPHKESRTLVTSAKGVGRAPPTVGLDSPLEFSFTDFDFKRSSKA